MKKISKILSLLLVSSIALVGCGSAKSSDEGKSTERKTAILEQPFSDYVENAKGKTVTFYGWGGSDQTNNYIDHYIAPMVKKNYDITLKRVGMNIDEILNNMQNQAQAGKQSGDIDIIWINGENFYTAKKNNLLFGPFVDKLPNFNKYIDKNSPEVTDDFGYKTDGYEAPFGKAQLVMIYNSDKLKPVKTLDDLYNAAKENPGKITYPALPDFTGSAFVRTVINEKVGYDKLKNIDPKDREAVKKAIQPAMDYLKKIKPYLWKQGKTYPAESTVQNNMYADGSLIFDVSYNPNFASNMIEKGTFPKSTRTCIFDKGTVGNTHFLAIAKNAPQKEAAMVVVNEILSFKAQLEKYKPDVWGDLPVLDNSKLSPKEKQEIDSVKIGPATLPQSELLSHRVPELPAAMVPVIESIWQEEIPGK